MLFEGLLNLCLSVLWVRGSLGILGVAWGTVIPNFMASLIFWPWYIRRTLQIDPVEYVVSAWLRPGIAILPFAIASFAIEHFLPATTLFVFFVQVGCLLPLAAVGYWRLCLDPEQRSDFSRRLAGLVGRAPVRG
jgi:Na+-driven multidrug efflux pump